MGRDFIGVWTGLHPLFAFLFGGDSCCFCCCYISRLVFDGCSRRLLLVLTCIENGINGCRFSGGLVRTRLSGRLPYGLFYGLSFGLLPVGWAVPAAGSPKRLPCTGCFREEDAERRLPRFGVIWVRSSAVNSKRSYRLNTGGEKGKVRFLLSVRAMVFYGSGYRFYRIGSGRRFGWGRLRCGSISGSGALVCSGTVFGAGACSTSLVCSGVSFNRVGWVCCTCALRCCSSNGRNC